MEPRKESNSGYIETAAEVIPRTTPVSKLSTRLYRGGYRGVNLIFVDGAREG